VSELEVRGVRLRDVYRDTAGDLWEVVALVTEPQAIFQRVRDGERSTHVVGCPNMTRQFPEGPLRETGARALERAISVAIARARRRGEGPILA
jgi:hypothetical protein